jgi:hypothetical protein
MLEDVFVAQFVMASSQCQRSTAALVIRNGLAIAHLSFSQQI